MPIGVPRLGRRASRRRRLGVRGLSARSLGLRSLGLRSLGLGVLSLSALGFGGHLLHTGLLLFGGAGGGHLGLGGRVRLLGARRAVAAGACWRGAWNRAAC